MMMVTSRLRGIRGRRYEIVRSLSSYWLKKLVTHYYSGGVCFVPQREYLSKVKVQGQKCEKRLAVRKQIII